MTSGIVLLIAVSLVVVGLVGLGLFVEDASRSPPRR